MNVDRNTVLKYINICFDNDTKLLEDLKAKAKENDIEDSLQIISHEGSGDECYFEKGYIHFSGEVDHDGKSTYVSFELPLSTNLLFDILAEGIKKFNKVKTIMEAVD